MAQAPYIGATLPAKVIFTDGTTTLFQYAAAELKDALKWWQIADLNGLSDPWVPGGFNLKIPMGDAVNNDGLPYA